MSDVRTKVFKPNNEKQRKYIASAATEILYSGAVGAGKSFAICQKMHMLMLMYPGNKGLLVRKENTAVKRTTVSTLLEEVIPPDHILAINRSEGFVRIRTGAFDIDGKEIFSEIHWTGLDKAAGQDYPTKILSTQFGAIGMDEAIECSEKDWEVLMTRLRYKPTSLTDKESDAMPRQIFCATNPDGPNHWLYKRFFDNAKEDRVVVLATPYDNPNLPKQYIKNLEENLAGLTRDRLLFGKWVQSEGVIYKNFNPRTMVIEKSALLPMNDYKRFVLGADSNFPLPRAACIIGIRGDGFVDVIDEFYVAHAHVDDLKAWLIEWRERLNTNLTVYHDPSDAHAISKLRGEGVLVKKANNQVVPGISSVSFFIDHEKFRITKSCPNLIRELQTYKWSKDREGDRPDKSDDHAVDALRYALHSDKKNAGHRPAMSF